MRFSVLSVFYYDNAFIFQKVKVENTSDRLVVGCWS